MIEVIIICSLIYTCNFKCLTVPTEIIKIKPYKEQKTYIDTTQGFPALAYRYIINHALETCSWGIFFNQHWEKVNLKINLTFLQHTITKYFNYNNFVNLRLIQSQIIVPAGSFYKDMCNARDSSSQKKNNLKHGSCYKAHTSKNQFDLLIVKHLLALSPIFWSIFLQIFSYRFLNFFAIVPCAKSQLKYFSFRSSFCCL